PAICREHAATRPLAARRQEPRKFLACRRRDHFPCALDFTSFIHIRGARDSEKKGPTARKRKEFRRGHSAFTTFVQGRISRGPGRISRHSVIAFPKAVRDDPRQILL